MSATHKAPTFFELSRDEAVDLLARNRFGRLAFSFHDRVDIEPISYVLADDWLYARTSPGTKLTVVQHHPWVAFEVDEIHSRVEWRSVVVHGTIYFMDPDREADRRDYDAAVKVLRSVDADALTPADATPQRQVLFRIHVDDVVGKGAKPGGR
jgi:nitroimidazol reductase NimA-like FMN-containing flavoprotein (pyridoxamine 5'-phosphate oxidase superfamily)